MRNIKVIDINNSNNFYIHDFFSWDQLVLKNLTWLVIWNLKKGIFK
jgi:hypothetical protein